MKLPKDADLLALLDKFGRDKPKRPMGTGWRTIAEMAQEKATSVATISQRLRRAAGNGLKIERFDGSDYGDAGDLVKRVWFRVKP